MSCERELAAITRLLAEVARPLEERDRAAMRRAVDVLAPTRPSRHYVAEVDAYLEQHPGASAIQVAKAIGASKERVLAAMRALGAGPARGTGPPRRVQPSGRETPKRTARALRSHEEATA